MELKIYSKETTDSSITVSINNIPEDSDVTKIKFEISNAYDFEFEQCIFKDGESKKVILNRLMPGTRYRVYGYVFENGKYNEIGSAVITTVSKDDRIVAIKPTGALE